MPCLTRMTLPVCQYSKKICFSKPSLWDINQSANDKDLPSKNIFNSFRGSEIYFSFTWTHPRRQGIKWSIGSLSGSDRRVYGHSIILPAWIADHWIPLLPWIYPTDIDRIQDQPRSFGGGHGGHPRSTPIPHRRLGRSGWPHIPLI